MNHIIGTLFLVCVVLGMLVLVISTIPCMYHFTGKIADPSWKSLIKYWRKK
jgi:hypothetical protein